MAVSLATVRSSRNWYRSFLRRRQSLALSRVLCTRDPTSRMTVPWPFPFPPSFPVLSVTVFLILLCLRLEQISVVVEGFPLGVTTFHRLQFGRLDRTICCSVSLATNMHTRSILLYYLRNYIFNLLSCVWCSSCSAHIESSGGWMVNKLSVRSFYYVTLRRSYKTGIFNPIIPRNYFPVWIPVLGSAATRAPSMSGYHPSVSELTLLLSP